MSKGQHTPGPWVIVAFDKERAEIRPSDNSYGFVDVWQFSHYPSEWDLMANARLIAAAPELLEALEDLICEYECIVHEQYDGTDMLGAMLDNSRKASAAIAKARGEA